MKCGLVKQNNIGHQSTVKGRVACCALSAHSPYRTIYPSGSKSGRDEFQPRSQVPVNMELNAPLWSFGPLCGLHGRPRKRSFRTPRPSLPGGHSAGSPPGGQPGGGMDPPYLLVPGVLLKGTRCKPFPRRRSLGFYHYWHPQPVSPEAHVFDMHQTLEHFENKLAHLGELGKGTHRYNGIVPREKVVKGVKAAQCAAERNKSATPNVTTPWKSNKGNGRSPQLE